MNQNKNKSNMSRIEAQRRDRLGGFAGSVVAGVIVVGLAIAGAHEVKEKFDHSEIGQLVQDPGNDNQPPQPPKQPAP